MAFRHLNIFFALSALLFAGLRVSAVAANVTGTVVMSTPRRMQAIKTADSVLAQKLPTWETTVVDLPDPFYRPKFVPEVGPEPTSTAPIFVEPGMSDEEVLDSVAPKIRPTGTMVIGNEPYLLLVGKRYATGDKISVRFEGKVYHLDISSIERNSYTLRLNEYELERYFK